MEKWQCFPSRNTDADVWPSPIADEAVVTVVDATPAAINATGVVATADDAGAVGNGSWHRTADSSSADCSKAVAGRITYSPATNSSACSCDAARNVRL